MGEMKWSRLSVHMGLGRTMHKIDSEAKMEGLIVIITYALRIGVFGFKIEKELFGIPIEKRGEVCKGAETYELKLT